MTFFRNADSVRAVSSNVISSFIGSGQSHATKFINISCIFGAIFTARAMLSAVLGVLILSVCPSVRLSHASFVTNPKNRPAIFLYRMKGQSF